MSIFALGWTDGFKKTKCHNHVFQLKIYAYIMRNQSGLIWTQILLKTFEQRFAQKGSSFSSQLDCDILFLMYELKKRLRSI